MEKMEENKKCEICAKDIPKTNKTFRFCGTICKKRFKRWEKLTPEERQEKIKNLTAELECQTCGEKYKPKTTNQTKFCSLKCHDRYYQPIVKVEKVKEVKICEICSISYQQNENSQGRFCSAKCRRRKHLWQNLTEEERQEKINSIGIDMTCLNCGETSKSRRTNQMKYCSRKCHDDHKNKNIAQKKQECRDYLRELKKKQSMCATCYETNTLLFEFAHFDRKYKEIDVHECCDIKKLKKELFSGIFKCIWCHRLETRNEVPKNKNPTIMIKIDYVNNIKKNIGKCQLCEIEVTDETLCCFDFDHLNPETKIKEISQMVRNPIERIQTEIDKCRLLCCKCHRLHTIQQNKEKLEKQLLEKQLLNDNQN